MHPGRMSISTRRRRAARRRDIRSGTPRAVGPLLDEYIRVCQPMFTNAQRILSPNALPQPFRGHAEHCDESAQWRAWIDLGRIWFLTGRIVSEPGSCAEERCASCSSMRTALWPPVRSGCAEGRGNGCSAGSSTSARTEAAWPDSYACCRSTLSTRQNFVCSLSRASLW